MTNGDLKANKNGFLSRDNKSEIAKIAGVGRRTLYDLMDEEKEFNPELSTVSAIIRALAA